MILFLCFSVWSDFVFRGLWPEPRVHGAPTRVLGLTPPQRYSWNSWDPWDPPLRSSKSLETRPGRFQDTLSNIPGGGAWELPEHVSFHFEGFHAGVGGTVSFAFVSTAPVAQSAASPAPAGAKTASCTEERFA